MKNLEDEKLLGNRVEKLLATLGAARVAKLVEKVGKRPCGCGGRRDKINDWHRKMLNAIEELKK